MKQLVLAASVVICLTAAGQARADRYYDCEATFFTQSGGPVQGRLWISDVGRSDASQFRRAEGRLEFTELAPARWQEGEVRLDLAGGPAVGHAEALGAGVAFSGVYGTQRDGLWWADCQSRATPPAWARDGETVSGVEQELRALQGLNMDTGRILAASGSDDVDIFLGMFMGRSPVIAAGPQARIMLSSTPPGFSELDPGTADCSGVRNERPGGGIPFVSIERGAIICVLTNDRYLGALRVTSADGGDDPHLRFSFERWGVVR
ncbi:hypothetical protein L2D01_04155 [Hyphomonadaceae bacterium ML37]|nr:hypothetical protein L2D01_04155 [Hyphomonadaceae bacterium ML37]